MFKIFQIRYEYFYGGILTMDTLGCNLNCAFCFKEENIKFETSSNKFSQFLEEAKNKFFKEIQEKVAWKHTNDKIYEVSSIDLVNSIINFSNECKFSKLRLSSGEPTLSFDDFLSFCEIFDKKRTNEIFILETNGVNFGRFKEKAKKLAKYRNWLHIRLSLKIIDKNKFKAICGNEKSFNYMRDALNFLIENRNNYSFHIVYVWDLLSQQDFDYLLEHQVKERNLNIEFEPLYYYPHVIERINNRNLNSYFKI